MQSNERSAFQRDTYRRTETAKLRDEPDRTGFLHDRSTDIFGGNRRRRVKFQTYSTWHGEDFQLGSELGYASKIF